MKRDQADAIYHAFLSAIDAGGNFPYFRADVIEECGKAFERFLEEHCLAKKAISKRKKRTKGSTEVA